jgi:hypothetical protein
MGAVQLMLGGLRRDRAALLAARGNAAKNLAPVLQANKIPPPPELAEQNVESQVAAARDAAKQAYDEADKLLTDVVETKSGDAMTRAARAGHTLRLAGLYARAQLAAGTSPQEAQQWIAKAKQLATQAEGDLPAANALPAFIQDVLELRPATLTTGPAGRTVTTPKTPAPTIPTPAPTTPTPAPTTPAPAPTTPAPAPGTVAPAPGTETPAPGTETPAAPQQAAPAPGQQPAPGADGTATPAAPEGQQPAPAPAPAPAGQEGAQPASDSQTPAPAPAPAPAPSDAGTPPAGGDQPPAGQK